MVDLQRVSSGFLPHFEQFLKGFRLIQGFGQAFLQQAGGK